MLHQDKKRWKQVKYHWFDIIQPIRLHLRWKFFTIGCEICQNLIFYVTGKVENFDGMNCFFLHCHPISYFIIHVCNQKMDKHSKMAESWNVQTSPYQRLKSNFRVLHLIPIFLGLMHYTKIRKDENKLSIIDLTLYSQSDHILLKILYNWCKYVTNFLYTGKVGGMHCFSFIAILFLISCLHNWWTHPWLNPEIYKYTLSV